MYKGGGTVTTYKGGGTYVWWYSYHTITKVMVLIVVPCGTTTLVTKVVVLCGTLPHHENCSTLPIPVVCANCFVESTDLQVNDFLLAPATYSYNSCF